MHAPTACADVHPTSNTRDRTPGTNCTDVHPKSNTRNRIPGTNCTDVNPKSNTRNRIPGKSCTENAVSCIGFRGVLPTALRSGPPTRSTIMMAGALGQRREPQALEQTLAIRRRTTMQTRRTQVACNWSRVATRMSNAPLRRAVVV
eukprot:241178-Rhodomonas_salina.2